MIRFFAAEILSRLPVRRQRQAAGLVALSLLNPFFDLTGVAILAPLVTTLSSSSVPGNVASSALVRIPLELLSSFSALGLSFFLGGIFLLKGAFLLAYSYSLNSFINNSRSEMSTELLGAFLHEPAQIHVKRLTEENISLLHNDMEACCSLLGNSIQLAANILSCLLLLCVLLFVDYTAALLSAAVVGFFTAVMYLAGQKRYMALNRRHRELNIQSRSLAARTLGAWKEIRIRNNADSFVSLYSACCQSAAEARTALAVSQSLPQVILQSVVIALALLLFGVAAGMSQEKLSRNLPAIITFFVMFSRFLPTALGLIRQVLLIRNAMPSCEKILETAPLVQRNTPYAGADCNATPASAPLTLRHGIRMRDIHFSYDTTFWPVFSGVNITIPKGFSVAVIGKTGAGKTTLLDIMMGIQSPEHGNVYYDDVAVTEVARPNLSEIIAYIPQTVYLNGETILDNILFGADRVFDPKRLERVLNTLDILSLVERFPQGLHARLGENGLTVSGGERQRIALARALYAGVSMLVLDESLSAVDEGTERTILSHILSAKDSSIQTLVMVTHRHKTAEQCDIIYQVADGGIEILKGRELLESCK